MNILHNAEAVFALVATLAIGAIALPGNALDRVAAPLTEVSVATPTQVAVVKVAARRLTVIEKMRSLEDERALARAALTPRG